MSHQKALVRKRNKQTDIQDDETAPEVKPAIRLYYGQDITGNEDDTVF